MSIRIAYVTIKSFGTIDQQTDLANKISEQTPYFATVDLDRGVVFMVVELHELAEFFDTMEQNSEFNWIEYTVKLDH